MKKVVILIFITIIICSGCSSRTENGEQSDKPGNQEEVKLTQFASDNGWLHIEGTELKNDKNQTMMLKGISSHGIQWYSDILTYDNLKTLKETWGINVFRIAMYTDENGYIANKETIKEKVIQVANDVIKLDMYVIIDWHTLFDNNPNKYKTEAKEFFKEISELYKDVPNVIYEICNEPNGENITWDKHVKPYAEEIIPIIRENSPKSLIIVGTPDWSKALIPAANNPLDYDNILYSCHFYAGSHKASLRNEITKAKEKGLPIIVSEFGTTDASGNGKVNIEESTKWIEFLNQNNISFINWSLSYKEESSAILKKEYLIPPVADENGKIVPKDLNDYLTESGEFIKSVIKFD